MDYLLSFHSRKPFQSNIRPYSMSTSLCDSNMLHIVRNFLLFLCSGLLDIILPRNLIKIFPLWTQLANKQEDRKEFISCRFESDVNLSHGERKKYRWSVSQCLDVIL